MTLKKLDSLNTSIESLFLSLSMSLSDIEQMFKIFSNMSGWSFVICLSIVSLCGYTLDKTRNFRKHSSSKLMVTNLSKAFRTAWLNIRIKHYILPLLLIYLSTLRSIGNFRIGLEFFSKFWFIKRQYSYLYLLWHSFERFIRGLLNDIIEKLSYIVVVLASEGLR